MNRADRRRFVQGASALGLGLVVGCGRWPGQAPRPARVPRIGYLGFAAPGVVPGGQNADAVMDALRELGYVDGQNISIEWRATGGDPERVQAAAVDLIALQVDAVVVTGVIGAQALQNATRTIPTVIVMLSDPVATGFVSSLARPGGNITGLGSFALELSGKQLQLLREAIPSVARVGVLWQTPHPGKVGQLKEIQEAGAALGIGIESLAVGEPQQLASAIQAGIQARVDAVFPLQSDLTVQQRAPIVDLVAQAGLPAMYEYRDWTEAGGLLSYGPNFIAMHRRAAYYVDRILKGAKPAELPVERPREFDFIVNLRTAQALGLTIPPHVLMQATEVLQ
jgi:putative tryptophan/tyrosine transport system substrate-binding protein